jgi:hypothetical protein
MPENTPQLDADVIGGRQFREALDRIGQIVLDGLRHGHFRCAISSGIGKGNRRKLMIEAGKSHKFTIPEEEPPRGHGAKAGDPCDWDAEYANDKMIQRHRCESEAGDQGHGAAKSRP